VSDDHRDGLPSMPAPAAHASSDPSSVPASAPVGDAAGADQVGAPRTFIGPRGRPRWRVESVFVRVVATSGIVGICVALAAILGTQSVAAWIIGLAVSAVSVVFAAVLWSSRTL